MAALMKKVSDPRPTQAATASSESPAPDTPAPPSGIPQQALSVVMSQWQFVVDHIKNMPAWVRVLTYLVILALYAYNSLLPTTMGGSFMQRDLSGHLVMNSKIAYVAPWFEDVELKVRLSGPGWRVPIMNRGPWKTQHLNFYDKDDRYIDFVDPIIPSLIFSSSDIALVYDEKSGKVVIERNAGHSGVATALLALIPSASAQQADKPAAASTDCDDPCLALARLANVDPGNLHAGATLTSLATQQDLNGFRDVLASRVAIDPQKVNWDKIRTVEDFHRAATAYSAVGNITPEVKTILTGTSTRDLRVGLGDDSRQLRTARESLKVPADETVLAFLNATITGNGVEGMLFGARGVYYRTSWARRDGPEVAYISYDDLAERSFEDKGSSQVSLDRGQYFVTAKSTISSRQLVAVLDQIKRAAKAHHVANAGLWH